MAAAAGGGGGGGAAAAAIDDSALVDCRDSVLRFMDMIGIKDGDVDKFLTVMMNLDPIEDDDEPEIIKVREAAHKQLKEYVKSLRLLSDLKMPDGTPDTLSMMMRPKPGGGGQECVRGGFGCIMLSKDPKVIWKSVDIANNKKYLPMIFIESFIQFILCDAKPSLRDNVIPLLDIRRNAASTRMYICMERADTDVFHFLAAKRIMAANGKRILPDAVIKSVLDSIINTLIRCYRYFNFVHRDAKSDNFVLVADAENNAKIKMIDFGMACIDILVDDSIYSIRSYADNYMIPTLCAPQQDMLVLLYELQLSFGRFFEPGGKIQEFYHTLIPPAGGLHSAMTKRQSKYKNRDKHHASYNKNGSLSKGAAKYLTPQHVLSVLTAVFTRPPSPPPPPPPPASPRSPVNMSRNRTKRRRSNSDNSGNSPIYEVGKHRNKTRRGSSGNH